MSDDQSKEDIIYDPPIQFQDQTGCQCVVHSQNEAKQLCRKLIECWSWLGNHQLTRGRLGEFAIEANGLVRKIVEDDNVSRHRAAECFAKVFGSTPHYFLPDSDRTTLILMVKELVDERAAADVWADLNGQKTENLWAIAVLAYSRLGIFPNRHAQEVLRFENT